MPRSRQQQREAAGIGVVRAGRGAARPRRFAPLVGMRPGSVASGPRPRPAAEPGAVRPLAGEGVERFDPFAEVQPAAAHDLPHPVRGGPGCVAISGSELAPSEIAALATAWASRVRHGVADDRQVPGAASQPVPRICNRPPGDGAEDREAIREIPVADERGIAVEGCRDPSGGRPSRSGSMPCGRRRSRECRAADTLDLRRIRGVHRVHQPSQREHRRNRGRGGRSTRRPNTVRERAPGVDPHPAGARGDCRSRASVGTRDAPVEQRGRPAGRAPGSSSRRSQPGTDGQASARPARSRPRSYSSDRHR